MPERVTKITISEKLAQKMLKKHISSYFPIIYDAFLSGLLVGAAGTVYLSVYETYKVVGAFCSSVALLTILVKNYKLFTGVVGYFFRRGKLPVLIIYIGNFAGCFSAATILKKTRINSITETAKGLAETKLNDNYLSVFILAIFCGILMYAATDTFKNLSIKNDIAKVVLVFFCIAVFILAGFEHCISNMFYFSLAGSFNNYEAWLKLLVMTLGNGVGSVIFDLRNSFNKEPVQDIAPVENKELVGNK